MAGVKAQHVVEILEFREFWVILGGPCMKTGLR
jgi:hypothetical protein